MDRHQHAYGALVETVTHLRALDRSAVRVPASPCHRTPLREAADLGRIYAGRATAPPCQQKGLWLTDDVALQPGNVSPCFQMPKAYRNLRAS
jgi:hypothetical protein